MRSKLLLCFEGLLYLFIFSLFITLGSDRGTLLNTRMIFGAAAGLLGILLLFQEIRKSFHFPLIFFTVFLIFELVRALCLGVFFKDPVYFFSPLKWAFYLVFFAVSFIFFKSRGQVSRLTQVLVWSGFFLAANAFPPLIQHHSLGYVMGKAGVFFHPLFYPHPWAQKYLFGSFAHLNYVGDLMAFGFFAALGAIFYTYHLLRDRFKYPESDTSKAPVSSQASFLFLQSTAALLIAAVVFLLFSRGTIVFFASAFLFFLLISALKFPRKSQTIFVLLVFGGLFGFLLWTGNFNAAVQEIGTLQKETQSEKSSFNHNVEGAQRALRIFQAKPIWGAGTDGYSRLAPEYATKGKRELALADYEAMCHYLHVLAEEGAGAFLYFLFLLTYFLGMMKGLFVTKSRFKFTAALALFSAVLMILGHASINHLMQRFPIALLTYICMGAGLGILRDDFKHEA